jgi:hypothetical protein
LWIGAPSVPPPPFSHEISVILFAAYRRSPVAHGSTWSTAFLSVVMWIVSGVPNVCLEEVVRWQGEIWNVDDGRRDGRRHLR